MHVFVSVLIIGTLWRLLCYHALASNNEKLQHIGAAGLFQY